MGQNTYLSFSDFYALISNFVIVEKQSNHEFQL